MNAKLKIPIPKTILTVEQQGKKLVCYFRPRRKLLIKELTGKPARAFLQLIQAVN